MSQSSRTTFSTSSFDADSYKQYWQQLATSKTRSEFLAFSTMEGEYDYEVERQRPPSASSYHRRKEQTARLSSEARQRLAAINKLLQQVQETKKQQEAQKQMQQAQSPSQAAQDTSAPNAPQQEKPHIEITVNDLVHPEEPKAWTPTEQHRPEEQAIRDDQIKERLSLEVKLSTDPPS